MENIRHIIRNIIKEHINIIQEISIYDNGKNIPQGIKNWLKSSFGHEVPKYEIIQGESEVTIHMPWHEADKETYQFFKLEANGNAIPVGNGISRSGMESDSAQDYAAGQKNQGKVKVPEGFVLVCHSTYPRRVRIYTGENVMKVLPDKTKSNDLTSTELVILASAKSLKPAYRIKFKDDEYLNLIAKGLLKPNRSITVDGRNVLEDPDVKQRLETIKNEYREQRGIYLSF